MDHNEKIQVILLKAMEDVELNTKLIETADLILDTLSTGGLVRIDLVLDYIRATKLNLEHQVSSLRAAAASSAFDELATFAIKHQEGE